MRADGHPVGLALAHWFAFRFAAPAFRGDRVTKQDTRIGLAQVGAAMFVAAVSSLPDRFHHLIESTDWGTVAP